MEGGEDHDHENADSAGWRSVCPTTAATTTHHALLLRVGQQRLLDALQLLGLCSAWGGVGRGEPTAGRLVVVIVMTDRQPEGVSIAAIIQDRGFTERQRPSTQAPRVIPHHTPPS